MPVKVFLPSPSVASRGFSLIEMLMVIAVATLLMSLAAPALIRLAPGRKGAIREVKLTLERARLIAEKEERMAFVAFADDSSTRAASRDRLYAIFQAVEPGALDPETAPVTPVTGWRSLPPGFVFAKGADFEARPGERFRTVMDSPHRRAFPPDPDNGMTSLSLPYFAFHPTGRIASPPRAAAAYLHCGIAEGYHEESGGRVLTGKRPGLLTAGEYAQGECLAIAHYTGRARLITD